MVKDFPAYIPRISRSLDFITVSSLSTVILSRDLDLKGLIFIRQLPILIEGCNGIRQD